MPAPLDAPRAPRLVSHFGPALGAPGGMGALLESYERLDVGGCRLEVVPTFHTPARSSSLGYEAAALRDLVRDRARRRSIRVHLSEGGSFLREGAIVLDGAFRGSGVVVSLHGIDHEAQRAPHRRLAQIEPLLARPVLLRADVVCGLSPGAAVAGAAGRTRVAEHLSADAVAAAMRSRHAGLDPLTTVAPAREAPGVPA